METNKRRKIIVVTIGILVLCGWSLLALYSIVGDRKNDLSFAPEVVYVPQAPAPAVGSGPSFYQSPRRGTLMNRPAVSYQHSTTNYTPAPKAAMGSTSFRVHQTSSAAVHSYGGGGTGGGGGSHCNIDQERIKSATMKINNLLNEYRVKKVKNEQTFYSIVRETDSYLKEFSDACKNNKKYQTVIQQYQDAKRAYQNAVK